MSKNKNKVEGKLIKLGEDKYDLLIDFDPNLLKGCKLSLENCQTIERGYDLDELAKIHHKLAYIQAYNPDIAPYVEADYKAGFQRALEILGDKKFSKQDMYKMFIYGRSIDTAKKHIKKLEDKPMDEFFNDFIQSLQQTKWNVEICCYVEEDSDSDSFTSPMLTNTGNPKLDENGCLILKRK